MRLCNEADTTQINVIKSILKGHPMFVFVGIKDKIQGPDDILYSIKSNDHIELDVLRCVSNSSDIKLCGDSAFYSMIVNAVFTLIEMKMEIGSIKVLMDMAFDYVLKQLGLQYSDTRILH